MTEKEQIQRAENARARIDVATTSAAADLAIVKSNHDTIVVQLREALERLVDTDSLPELTAFADRLDNSVTPLEGVAESLRVMAQDTSNPVPIPVPDPPDVEPS